MTGGQFMVVMIVAIVMIAMVMKAKFHRDGAHPHSGPGPEAEQLREEVRELKQRIHVLERIATERENSLTREIEELRDR